MRQRAGGSRSSAQAGAGVDITLVGMPESYGRGVAYGEARPEHLLYVRARDPGATADYPGELADWLNLTERARQSFLPRLLYAEYLHARLSATSVHWPDGVGYGRSAGNAALARSSAPASTSAWMRWASGVTSSMRQIQSST